MSSETSSTSPVTAIAEDEADCEPFPHWDVWKNDSFGLMSEGSHDVLVGFEAREEADEALNQWSAALEAKGWEVASGFENEYELELNVVQYTSSGEMLENGFKIGLEACDDPDCWERSGGAGVAALLADVPDIEEEEVEDYEDEDEEDDADDEDIEEGGAGDVAQDRA